ncbi:MAG: hypothetical protein ACREIQ_01990 [Nitrospiria bacterium]
MNTVESYRRGIEADYSCIDVDNPDPTTAEVAHIVATKFEVLNESVRWPLRHEIQKALMEEKISVIAWSMRQASIRAVLGAAIGAVLAFFGVNIWVVVFSTLIVSYLPLIGGYRRDAR